MDSGRYPAVTAAIKKHGQENVEVEIVRYSLEYKEAFALEVKLIKELNTLAPNGYNLTSGGEGVVGIPKEIREEVGRKKAERYKTDPEWAAKMRAVTIKSGPKVGSALKKWWETPAAENLRKSRSSTEFRKKISEANKRRSMEWTGKMSKSLVLLWKDEEYREKVNTNRDKRQMELKQDPEYCKKVRQRRSESMKKRWEDPEYRKRRASAQARPEVRKKLSLNGSGSAKNLTEEQKKERNKKVSDGMKAFWAKPENRERMILAKQKSQKSKKGKAE